MLSSEDIIMDQDAICESPSAEALHALVSKHMGAAWLPGILATSSDKLVPCPVPKALNWEYDIVMVSG
jgi:hypothetical protein